MMKGFQPPSSTENQRGQSLVELAVSLTFLLLLAGGAVDLGRAFFTYMSVRDAAQEGALYASYHPVNCTNTTPSVCTLDTSGINNRVRTSSTQPINLADTTSVTVGTSVIPLTAGGPTCAGGSITVAVTFKNFEFVMPIMNAFPKFDIHAAATDTILSPACQ